VKQTNVLVLEGLEINGRTQVAAGTGQPWGRHVHSERLTQDA